MPKRLVKEPTEQTQAKAVSNLLEIDLRQQEEATDWEEKRASIPAGNKGRTFSVFRISQQAEQHRTAKNCLRHRNFHYSNQKPSYDDLARSLREFPQDSNEKTPKERSAQALPQWAEGEFWSSKVNWMAESTSKEPSQHRLHKRRPNAFDNHGKAARERGNRYDNPERALSRQLRTNLGLNLNKQRGASQGKEEGLHKNWTAYSPKGKVSQYMKLKGSIQEYVRETFDRIYEKNHEENASSPHKQSEQEKSTIVRRLLNNLESIRDQVLIKQNQQYKRSTYRQRINDPRFKDAAEPVSNPQLPLPRSLLKRDQHAILNLNQQAQKVYQNRSINQFNKKNSSLINAQ